ncbi:MAG: hypothetical protein HYX84_00535 [Chloroflexi bacterium]|nr:hypothetical protein [Chloroflexota bacterium]
MTLSTLKPRGTTMLAGEKAAAMSGEFVALCPTCKAVQTIWLDNDRLTPTRKFSQHSRHVYHDCGSSEPCRLYRTY